MDVLAPGDRITAFRIDAGYKTRAKFCRALKANGMAINYYRLSRIETSKAFPYPYEIDSICELLDVTNDCITRGICDNPIADLAVKTHNLTDRQLRMLLELNAEQIPFIKKHH